MMDRFGELRTLLQQPPSSGIFHAITELFPDGQPNESCLVYGAEHMDRWPDTIPRQHPMTWVDSTSGDLAPAIRWCTHVSFSGNNGPSSAAVLALSQSKSLRHVHTLGLMHRALNDRDLYHLSCHAHLDNLRALVLEFGDMTHRGLLRLAKSTTFPQIHRLHLFACTVGAQGVDAMMEGRVFDRLESLCFGNIYLAHETVEAVVHSGLSHQLTVLNVGNCQLDDSVVETLMTPGAFPKLEMLVLMPHDKINAATEKHLRIWCAEHHIDLW